MAGYTFEVRPFHDNWGVFSYKGDPEDGRYDLVFSTEDRAIAAREIIEHWYRKGGFDERNIDDSEGIGYLP